MEEDVCFHRSVEVEATQSRGLVKEICAGDLAIRALLCGIPYDQLDHVHLLDHVLESADIGVGDLAANRDVAKGGEVLEEVVGQLVARSLADDALEVLGLNETIFVAVKVHEALSHSLALQSAQHLGELRVGHRMSVLLGPNVESCPLAFPVEGQAVLCLVCLPCLIELVEIDVSGPVLVEEAEDDLVLGVGFREEVLEDGPVVYGDLAFPVAIGYSKQDAVLVALDFVLWRGAP